MRQPSHFDTLFLLDEGDVFAKVADDRFQFRDRFSGEILRVGQIATRFPRLVFESGDVELVRPLGNLGRVEATKAAGLSQVCAFRLTLAVRVGTVALLELGEVLRAERPVLLRDAGDVAYRVTPHRILPPWFPQTR